MKYIITKRPEYFDMVIEKGITYSFCTLEGFKDKIRKESHLAYDSETTGLAFYNNDLFAIQIGTYEDQFLFDLEGGINPDKVFDIIKDKTLVIHNALFDLTFMYKHNFFPWNVKCTFLTSKILYNGLVQYRHNFGAVMERELDLHYDKSQQSNINKIKLSSVQAIKYCFADVDNLLKLKDELEKKIYDGGYEETYILHNKWIRACAYMQCCGLPINESKWQEKINNDKKELREKEIIIKDYIFDHLSKYRNTQLDLFNDSKKLNISITSPKQMIPVFEDFGVDCTDEDKKSGKSISENVINKSDHEFVNLWKDYQSIKHDVTTFGENFIPSIWKGRLYTNYKPILDTARISAGGKSKVKGN